MAAPPSLATLKFLICFLSLLTPVHPSVTNSTDNLFSSDLQALEELKSSVVSSSSPSLDHLWKPEIHACQWVGITCFKNRVTRLFLDGFNFTGSFQPVARLQKLTVLRLQANQFTTIPNLSGLKYLRALSLSGNNLTGHLPDWLGSNLELKNLDVSFNSLAGTLPVESLNGLTRLKRLRLEGNGFSGKLSGLDLPGLMEFNVSDNNFTGEIPLSLSGFPCSAFSRNHLFPLPNCSDIAASSVPDPATTPPGRGIRLKWVIIMATGFLLVVLISCLGYQLYQADPDPDPVLIPTLYIKDE